MPESRGRLYEEQERERRENPPCPRCGKPEIRTRLAIGSVVHTGPGRYRAQQLESAADLGACQCLERAHAGYYDAERIGQVIDQLPDYPMGAGTPPDAGSA